MVVSCASAVSAEDMGGKETSDAEAMESESSEADYEVIEATKLAAAGVKVGDHFVKSFMEGSCNSFLTNPAKK